MKRLCKIILTAVVMVIAMHGTSFAQNTADMDARLKAMETKLAQMQVKLDSMKKLDSVRTKSRIVVDAYNGDLYTSGAKVYKVAPRVAVPRTPTMPKMAISPMPPMKVTTAKAFSSSMSFKGYNDNEKEMDEKIKAGTVKQKTKSFTKSYPIGKEDKLAIDNQFGKVIINTWNKNEFKVDVEIKSDADDDDQAQKLLDRITIEDSKDGNNITFSTKMAKTEGNNWMGIMTTDGKTSVRKAVANYTIYMPAKNALQINNRFGSIEVPDFEGKLNVTGMYSNLTAKKLSNTGNDINIRMGTTNIESLNGGQLKINYGNVTLGSADNLNADISMATAKVNKLRNGADISTRYGSLQLSDLDKNLKNFSLKSNFTDVAFNLNNNQNFDFDVTTTNASFDYGNHDVTVTSTSPDDNHRWSPIKTYKGHLGKGDADKVLTIKASYGDVKFNLQ